VDDNVAAQRVRAVGDPLAAVRAVNGDAPVYRAMKRSMVKRQTGVPAHVDAPEKVATTTVGGRLESPP